MNILLTNDDGYFSEGIITLNQVLSEKHNTYIIAPDTQKSACSCAITVRSSISVQTISESIYSVDGFPADCVNIGLNGDLVPNIDLVISGINHGPNLGDDIHFSGTVAGARTAFVFGVSGIAISMDCLSTSDYFADAALFVSNFVEMQRNGYRAPYFFNINYPDRPAHEIHGIRYTNLGKREYRDSYTIVHHREGEMTLQLNGAIDSVDNHGSDITELRKGFITITPLTLDATDYNYLERLQLDHE